MNQQTLRKLYRSTMKSIKNRRVLSIIPSPILRDPNPKPDAKHPEPLRFESSSMAMAALVLLLALFFMCFFSTFTRRLFALFHGRDSHLQYTPPSPRRPRRFLSLPTPYGLDPEVLQSMPVIKGKKELGCCVVCLSDFEEKECVKIIPRCGHVFHPGCIDPWLLSRGSCPVCRCSGMLLTGSQSCPRLEFVPVDENRENESIQSSGEEEVEREGGGGGGERKVVLGRSGSLGHQRGLGGDGRVGGGMRRTCSF